MKFILALTVVVISKVSFSQDVTTEDFVIGERIEFASEILKENRILNIYLPSSYHPDSAKLYPVIYLLDGSKEEDFIHISGLVQFCSYPWINDIEETIVVGIENVDRKKNFTFPTSNIKYKEDFPTTGHSKEFIRFISDELQPLIEKTYQVNDSKTLIGQSLGGLLATEILLTNESLFTSYIIVSPSLWWDDQSLLNLNKETYSDDVPVFVAVGKEGKIMEKDAKSLYKKLKSNSTSEKIYFNFFKDKTHGDVLHSSVYEAFVKLFRIEPKD